MLKRFVHFSSATKSELPVAATKTRVNRHESRRTVYDPKVRGDRKYDIVDGISNNINDISTLALELPPRGCLNQPIRW